MYVYPETPVVTAAELAAQRKQAKREVALRSIAHNTVGERKANAKDYGVRGRWATVTVLAPSGRGRNARGTSASKKGWGSGVARTAKRAKKQNTAVMGATPRLSATRWGNV